MNLKAISFKITADGDVSFCCFTHGLRPFSVKTVCTIYIERNESFTVHVIACDIQVRKINRAAFKIVADILEAIGPRYLALLNGPHG